MSAAAHDVRLTQGHVLRHAPAQSAQGRGAALRKVYAGAAGRFSNRQV